MAAGSAAVGDLLGEPSLLFLDTRGLLSNVTTTSTDYHLLSSTENGSGHNGHRNTSELGPTFSHRHAPSHSRHSRASGDGSKSKRSGKSRSSTLKTVDRMQLAAEEARLSLEQAKRRALFSARQAELQAQERKREAELQAEKAKQEAELHAEQIKLDLTEKVERAELRANAFEAFLASSSGESEVSGEEQAERGIKEIPVDSCEQRTSAWVETANDKIPLHEDTQPRITADQTPLIDLEPHVAYHSTPHVQDGVERHVAYHSTSHAQDDVKPHVVYHSTPLTLGVHHHSVTPQQDNVFSAPPNNMNTALNPNAREFTPVTRHHQSVDKWIDDLDIGQETQLQDVNSGDSMQQILQSLVRANSEKDLPPIVIANFDGSAEHWPRFIEQFFERIHSRPGITDCRRMDLLQSHLVGDAKKLVAGIGHSGRNYAEALKELKRQFGHRNKVARAYLDKVTTGPYVNSSDPDALRQFYVAVRDCITTLSQLGYVSDLTGTDVLVKAAKRIPRDRVTQWNRYVARISRNREPSLYDLRNWLDECVLADFNPFAVHLEKKTAKNAEPSKTQPGGKPKWSGTSTSQMKPYSGGTSQSKPYSGGKPATNSSVTPKPSTMLNTTVNDKSAASTSETKDKQGSKNSTTQPANTGMQQEAPQRSTCPLCSESHRLFKCLKFINKNPDERRAVVMEHRLCLNCLRPSHRADACTSAVRCREQGCGRSHHTMLHQAKYSTKAVGVTVATTSSSEDTDSQSCFQLATVYAIGLNGATVKTVAMLDSASEITMISRNLSQQLGLKGKPRQLSIQSVNSQTTQPSSVVTFRVRPINDADTQPLLIKEAWTVDGRSFSCPSQRIEDDWEHVRDLGLPNIKSEAVEILLGVNVPEAHLHTEFRRGKPNQPVAVKGLLGWAVLGNSAKERSDEITKQVKLTRLKDTQLQEQIEQFWQLESFGTVHKADTPSSAEDRRAQRLLDDKTRLVDGHYEVPMLWKAHDIELPDNRSVAYRRYHQLENKLKKDGDFKRMYAETLNSYVTEGHARKVKEQQLSETSPRDWHLPHHGVTSPNKPGKVRVVFDAASSYQNTSLNDNLATGPDLLNSLLGVLQRFRIYQIAVVGDIRSMFHQVFVSEEDSKSLRFFWKENPDKPGPPDTMEMRVHIFGAADSPTCCNYALKRTAQDNADKFDAETVNTVLRSFYMDDLMKSVDAVPQAIELAHDVIKLLKLGGFRIHKFMSNSQAVLESIAESERAVQGQDFSFADLPVQRTLGLKWNLQEDKFIFECNPKDTVMTKRSVVSIMSSIFDPCGYLTPFVLRAKHLVQELWRSGLDWDDPLPENFQKEWQSWLIELDDLKLFALPRHHKLFTTRVTLVSVETFSDASEMAYGAVAFLRYTTEEGRIVCSLLAAKSHVASIKPTLSMPRLELQGAVLATRLSNQLVRELGMPEIEKRFWTDSTTVLSYIQNETRRFKPFVANRVAEIQDSTDPSQWHYVSTSQNPADHCTRGLKMEALSQGEIGQQWINGPDFLHREENSWSNDVTTSSDLEADDPEIKKAVTVKATAQVADNEETQLHGPLLEGAVDTLQDVTQFSTWRRLVRHTAWKLRAVRNFAAVIPRLKLKAIKSSYLQAEEYAEATTSLIQKAQQDSFPEELERLKAGDTVDSKSSLSPLLPTYDGRCIKVGGRLRKANIPVEAKYQRILPKDHVITRLLLADAHRRLAHCGAEHLIAAIRKRYWPVKVRTVAKRVIRDCLQCWRRKVRPVNPQMADLPECRLKVTAGAFYHAAVDYFGPMMVKLGRSTVKRWGSLFTCLGTRAVHVELADSLETDDFILCLRRFIGRRGHPKSIHSDNGTNFKGAEAELRQCLENLEQNKLQDFLAPQGIEWRFSPPAAPHFGGAWERLVKSVKEALRSTLQNRLVTDSVLRTALIEAEAVVNSRPLTHNSTEPQDYSALTPNHFLLGRADNCVPVDEFQDREINSRKRWRQAQVLANHICKRWIDEYLPGLTIRSKWRRKGQKIRVGDLVLLIDEQRPRGQWDLARIEAVHPGDDGEIRTVTVRTSKNSYVRPATKVCILEENVN